MVGTGLEVPNAIAIVPDPVPGLEFLDRARNHGHHRDPIVKVGTMGRLMTAADCDNSKIHHKEQ